MKVKFYVADFSLQPAAPFVQNDSQSFDVQEENKLQGDAALTVFPEIDS
jgi:hypothetical protein